MLPPKSHFSCRTNLLDQVECRCIRMIWQSHSRLVRIKRTSLKSQLVRVHADRSNRGHRVISTDAVCETLVAATCFWRHLARGLNILDPYSPVSLRLKLTRLSFWDPLTYASRPYGMYFCLSLLESPASFRDISCKNRRGSRSVQMETWEVYESLPETIHERWIDVRSTASH